MISGKKTANAVGGKTARACDSCVRKRARWYCAADDAFLCQSCDGSVHSANQLAGRHERVLIEIGSCKHFGSSPAGIGSRAPEPPWHQGLTRRARTPRPRSKQERKNGVVGSLSSAPLVPEIGGFEPSMVDDEEEGEGGGEEGEEFLYRVPVFDPFESELYNDCDEIGRSLSFIVENNKHEEDTCNLDDLQGFDILPTDDMELLELAADVESLLGNNNGYDDNGNDIGSRVKVEDEEEREGILGLDLGGNGGDMIDWDFDHESEMVIKEEEEKKMVVGVEKDMMMMMVPIDECKEETMVRKSSIVLRLNYEGVIDAWADQGCPWTNGTRPEVDFNGCWPDFMGLQWTGNNTPCGGVRGSDGGREARVSRYREKRRTRLFSKKIRYEVRKLNAEKRPRMKGRFVKREGNH
ncbi:hypothetical protein LXL04_026807 [Taraxacum kok-saghyz]